MADSALAPLPPPPEPFTVVTGRGVLMVFATSREHAITQANELLLGASITSVRRTEEW